MTSPPSSSPFKRAAYIAVAIAVLHPQVSSGVSLLLGLVFGVIAGNPYAAITKKLSPKVLSYSIVGLGASMDLMSVVRAGTHGVAYTALGIFGTLILGTLIGRLLKTEGETSLLLSVGTAICGGSAIAAVSAAINAKDEAISVSLACVFLLNAIALFLFPAVGHHFAMGANDFGLWSAIAIHDTSSVVGAALQFGKESLEVATTTKLVRALWIVPVTIAIVKWRARQGIKAQSKAKFPTFIIGFLLAAALVTFFPALKETGEWVATIARRTLVLALFFIGSALTRATLQKVGFRPFLQGVGLWLCVSGTSLYFILR